MAERNTGFDRGDARRSTKKPVALVALQSKELSKLAYAAIRTAIRNMELKPGEHLVESALARQLQTSSVPIREALLMLERDGFVKQIPHRGAFVNVLDTVDLDEIFELRELLEGRASAHASQLLPRQKLERLDAIVIAVDKAIVRRDWDSCHDAFIEFDDIIFDATPNQRLAAELHKLRDQVARIGLVTGAIPGRVEASQREHKTIVDAIRRRSDEDAEQSMRAHVRSLHDDLIAAGEPYLGVLRGESNAAIS